MVVNGGANGICTARPSECKSVSRYRVARGEITGRPQRKVASRIRDRTLCCCVTWKLIIVVDSSRHFTEAGRRYDMRRDQYLREEGYVVLRIPD